MQDSAMPYSRIAVYAAVATATFGMTDIIVMSILDVEKTRVLHPSQEVPSVSDTHLTYLRMF